jgi:hypothetical protein
MDTNSIMSTPIRWHRPRATKIGQKEEGTKGIENGIELTKVQEGENWRPCDRPKARRRVIFLR